MRRTGWMLGAAMLLALVAASQTQAADEAMVEGTASVELIFKMGRIENGQKTQYKSYRLVVAEGAAGSRLLAGRRVPFPGGDDGAVVYQNVGFATEARIWMVDKKTVKVVADFEDSRVIEGSDPPTVQTRQLAVSAIVREGVPVELTRVDGVEDISGYVDLEVRILD